MRFKNCLLGILIQTMFAGYCRADIQLHFLKDAEAGEVLFSTAYASEENNEWSVTLADCSSKSTSCDRNTKEKTILHRVPMARYLSKLAQYAELPERFVLQKDGDRLLERQITAAQEAKNLGAIEALNRHRTSLLKISGIRRHLLDSDESVNTNESQAMYADTLRPYELESLTPEIRRTLRLAEGDTFDLAARKVWFIPKGAPGTLGQNESLCRNANGSLPSVADVERVAKWLGSSALVRQLTETEGRRHFWLANRRHAFQPAERGAPPPFLAYYHRFFSFGLIRPGVPIQTREFQQTSSFASGLTLPQWNAVERENTDFPRWVEQTPRFSPLCIRNASPRGVTE